ncbi:MAG TPA: tetratricopeptide repeat protein [Pseudomonadota bacterium]|nr:tetratricopeptide repeat protein [Pseudomonadota bacterium]
MAQIPCRVFLLFAPLQDRDLCDELLVYLRAYPDKLELSYLDMPASGTALVADEDLVRDADLVVVLVSPHLLDPQNERCARALKTTLQLMERDRAHVIPVVLRAIPVLPDWLSALGTLQRLPADSSVAGARERQGWRNDLVSQEEPARQQVWISLSEIAIAYAQKLSWQRRDHNLPPPPSSDSVGRHMLLEQLHELLTSQGRESSAAAVCISQPQHALVGLGGVGKTHLAALYAYRYAEHYRSLLWVEAAGYELTSRFAELYSHLRLPGHLLPRLTDPERSKVAARMVQDALERGGPHLLILDNVDHPSAYQTWLPRFGRTRVLITTRRRDLPVGEKNTLEVGVLTEQEAMDLLMGRTEAVDGIDGTGPRQPLVLPSRQEDLAAQELCRLLGYLALPLRVVSRILQKRVRLPSEILADVRTHGGYDFLENEYFHQHPSVYNVFESSYAALGTDEARLVAQVAGFFSPVGIPVALLFNAKNQLKPESRMSENSSALETLLDYGMVQRSLGGKLSVHLLMQEYLRRKGGAPAQQAVLTALALKLRGPEAQTTPPDAEELARLEELRSHLEYAHEQVLERAGRGAVQSLSLHLYIPLRLAQHLSRRAEFEEALAICRHVFELGTTVPLKWRAAFHHYAGWFLYRLGRYAEARREYLRVLKLSRRPEAGPKGLPEALLCHTYHDLGLIASTLGDYNRALRRFKRSYAIRRRDQHTNPRAMLMSLHWIGQTYADRGNYARAIRVLQLVLSRKRQRLPSPQDPSIANTLHSIGEVQLKLGHLDGAQGAIDEACRIHELRHPTRNPDAISTYVLRAELLCCRGDFTAAERTLNHAWEMQEALQPDHPYLGIIARSQGSLQLARVRAGDSRGSVSAALSYLQRAYERQVKAYGPHHPQTALSLCKLGEAQAESGDLPTGRTSISRAHTLLRDMLGADHAETATCAYTLGKVLATQGALDEARSFVEQAVAAFKPVLGPTHPRTQAAEQLLLTIGSRPALEDHAK